MKRDNQIALGLLTVLISAPIILDTPALGLGFFYGGLIIAATGLIRTK